jgi:hypothetical protein
MHAKLCVVVVLSVLVLLSCGPQECHVAGEVFIVTRGGQSIKLGLVQISAIAEEAARHHLQLKEDEIIKTPADMRLKKELSGERSAHLWSPEFLLDGMPAPVHTAKTDSDGRFVLILPARRNYLLAATAQRYIGDDTEHYTWLVWAAAKGKKSLSLSLSNDNLAQDDILERLLADTH